MPKKSDTFIEIEARCASKSSIDATALVLPGETLISVEPFTTLLITTTDDSVNLPFPVKAKPKSLATRLKTDKFSDCCDVFPPKPGCKINSTGFVGNDYVVTATAKHPCGLLEFVIAICTVSYEIPPPPQPPEKLIRRLKPVILSNGKMAVIGNSFDCNKTTATKALTIRVPIKELTGFGFAILVKAVSCCDDEVLKRDGRTIISSEDKIIL